MVQVGYMVDFKRKVLSWDDEVVPMKESGNCIGGEPN